MEMLSLHESSIHPDADTITSERPDNRDTHQLDSGIALICISGGGEFETVRTWCDTVTKAGFVLIAPWSLQLDR